jgi:NADPH:quinone reductase
VRAWQLERLAGPEALRLVDVPPPDAGDGALVDVHAVGINFPDLLATQGRYQLRPELPFVPGCEIAGIVREAPAGSGWTAGQRVSAFVWHGGYAETVQVPLHMLAPVPERLSLTTAAAMVVNYHTAHFALARRGRLEPAE